MVEVNELVARGSLCGKEHVAHEIVAYEVGVVVAGYDNHGDSLVFDLLQHANDGLVAHILGILGQVAGNEHEVWTALQDGVSHRQKELVTVSEEVFAPVLLALDSHTVLHQQLRCHGMGVAHDKNFRRLLCVCLDGISH